jgi:hypothetical protein
MMFWGHFCDRWPTKLGRVDMIFTQVFSRDGFLDHAISGSMPRKSDAKPKQDDPKQSARFVETAKAIEASEDPKDFDKAFKKVTTRPLKRF